MEDIIIDIVRFLVITGVVGSIFLQVFLIPGSVIQFALILIYQVVSGDGRIGYPVIIVFGVLTVVAALIDNVVVALGAKKFKSSKWGTIGAFIGGIVTLFTYHIWPPFVLAVLFEYFFNKREVKSAFKAGFGAMIGFLCGYLLKIVITVIIAVFFVFIMLQSVDVLVPM